MVAGSIIKVDVGTCSEAPIPLDKKNCPRTYICCNDERLNYIYCLEKDVIADPTLPTIIPRDQFDYSVVIKKGEEPTEDSVGTLDTIVPISYAQIKKPQQGEEWYREAYPELPEDFYGILARYTWGEKFTKKSLKNEIKKYERKDKKKGKPAPQGLEILKGKHTIVFD